MSEAFIAVADPTRRTIQERLRRDGPLPLKAIADRLPITRQAVTKHLNALEASGLVKARKVGREKIHSLDAEPLRELHDWLQPYAEEWDRRLARLRTHLEEDP